MKKLFLALMIGATMIQAATTLATIGDTTITSEDITERLNSLPPQYAAYYASADGRAKILKQMIDEKLLYLEAQSKGLAENPEVIKTAEKFKQEIMTNYFLKEELAKLSVEDKEIQEYYDINKVKYVTPESIRASHILVKTEPEAVKLIGLLKKGGSFEDLAKKNSTCPSAPRGGDLEYFSQGQMVKPFEAAAFALKVGEYTKKPVETQFGWHIIKLTDRKPAQEKTFDEVKAEIKTELSQEKQKTKIEAMVKELEAKYPVKKAEQ